MQANVSTIKDCVGCGSCEQACMHGAVRMERDGYGFLYPKVDSRLCCNCGLCMNKCPTLAKNYKELSVAGRQPVCYAAYSNDEVLRKESSSGGIFSELGKVVILHGGVVYGARLISGSEVRHVRVTTVEGLADLRKSKYVPSAVGKCYRDVATDLKNGLKVLFSGTPCQIAGLKCFLGEDPENLVTVDLLCHGVPSPKVLDSYLKEKGAAPECNTIFRDKRCGWNGFCISFQRQQGSLCSHNDTDSFLVGFIRNLFLRRSCYECKFNLSEARPADVSLGDFWGCETIGLRLEVSDDRGVSAVLLNTVKGAALFERIRSAVSCERVKLEDVISGNPILRSPCAEHKQAKAFRDGFETGSAVSEVIDRCCSLPRDVLIINHSFSHNNFGAVLVAYAMEKLVESLGFSPQTLRIEYQGEKTVLDQFKDRWLHLTPVSVQLEGDWRGLNDKFHYFVVGSDQVWRNWFSNDSVMRNFFLDFATNDKCLVAYAASFGVSSFKGSASLKKKIARRLRSFAGVSVREYEGLTICQNDFGINAECVLDPTLVVGADAFSALTVGVELPKNPYLACMIFKGECFDNDATRSMIDDAASRMGVEVVDLFRPELSVEEWVALIQNAHYVVTDSYHGMMFSLLFNKQFLCFANHMGGESRFSTMAKKLGIGNRIYTCANDVCLDVLLKNEIDYEVINERISTLRQKSVRFLCLALAKRRVREGSKDYRWMTVCGVPVIKVKIGCRKERYYLFGFLRIYSRHTSQYD